MPWQRDLADLAGELDDTRTGYRYGYVVVHVPRRAGKSAAVLATLLHRCTIGAHQRGWYTAQTRADAAVTFRDDWAPKLTASPLHPRVLRVRHSNGSEAVRWNPTASGFALFAPTATAVHGQDADTAVVDEAWSFGLDAGGAVEAGVQPAQLTRRWRQLWIVSAGGTEESTWLASWLARARDRTPGVAVLDYGAEPGDDLDDPRVWARVHPAIGHTITTAAVASLRTTMDEGEWRRAVLGLWTPGKGAAAVLPAAGWAAGRDPDAAPTGTALAYGLDTSHDGTTTALVTATHDPRTDTTTVLLLDHTPGLDWLPARWRHHRAGHRGPLLADPVGPAARAVDTLVRAGLPVEQVTTSQYAAACAELLALVAAGKVRHRDQPALDAAAATTTARAIGDRWLFERRGTDAAPIVAAALAVWRARRPARVPTTAVAT